VVRIAECVAMDRSNINGYGGVCLVQMLLKVTELESSHSDDLDFTNRIDGTNSFLNLIHMPSGVVRKKHVCYERNETERNWLFIESLHVRSGR